MSETYDPTSLIAGDYPLAHRKVTIPEGEVYVRGTVLGAVNVGDASAAAKSGGNTGTGTITMDATDPVRQGAKSGVYTARCVATAANGGRFQVKDPEGYVLDDNYAVGATFDNDIKFVIADGGTDFAVGDGFDITVASASTYKKSASAAQDGSQNPACVLATDVDATDGDVDAPAYFSGEFAKEKMTFGTGHTADTVDAYFRTHNIPIFIRTLGPDA